MSVALRRIWLEIARFILIVMISSGAVAQTAPPPPVAPAPLWSANTPGDPANWATPEAACKFQHDYYNPNADFNGASYNGGRTAACQWTLNANSNTILPALGTASCASGWAQTSLGYCVYPGNRFSRADCNCDRGVTAPNAPGMPEVGNPVALNYGAKVEREPDYATADGRLSVERDYYSLPEDTTNVMSITAIPGFGARWHGLIPGRISVGGWNASAAEYLTVTGSHQLFGSYGGGQVTNNWTFNTNASNHSRLSFIKPPAGDRLPYLIGGATVLNGPAEARLDLADGDVIFFRRSGDANPADGVRYLVPIERDAADGYKLWYDYPDTGDYPSTVRDSLGRRISIVWNNADRTNVTGLSALHPVKVIGQLTLPDLTTLTYTYGYAVDQFGSTIHDRLAGATHANATGTVLWARTYLYENSAVPYGMTGKVDQNGNRLSTYSYDQAGLVASTELAGGVNKYTITNLVSTTGYDNFYRYVTNPLGHQDDYSFLKWHDQPATQRILTGVVGHATATVAATATSYDYFGYIGDYATASYNDENGVNQNIDIDGALRPTAVHEANSTTAARTTNMVWHPNFDLVTHEALGGRSVDYTYSPAGQLLTRTETDTTSQTVPYVTTGQTRTWTYVWNGNGRLSSLDGPKGLDANGKGDVDSYAYDTAGNLLTSTNGLGQMTRFATYDANGRPGSMTDPNGIVHLYAYDLLGRVLSVTVKHPTTPASDAITTFAYDVEGRVAGITSPVTDKLFIDYDLAGRVTAMRAASGEKVALVHDAMNDETSMTVLRANATTSRVVTRTFDELGRMLTETLGTGRTRSWGYDKLGNATLVTGARSNATQQAFDALDRLVTSVAPDQGSTSTAYDVQDGVTSVIDPITVTTSYVRNGFGEVIQEVSPDRGTSVYYYDAAGDRIASVDGRGQRVDYVRDALGRISSKTPAGRPASETIRYTYDAAAITGSYGVGRLASVVDSTGTTLFKYDHRGNVLSKRQTIGTGLADLQYSYDLSDRVIGMTYPSGRSVTYARDTKGRVTSVKTKAPGSSTSVTLVSGITYEPFGAVLSATYGNGLALLQSWGNDGRLASKRLYRSSTSANLSLLTYGYDNEDNIASIADGVDATRSITYGYDPVGRLSQSVIAAGSVRRQDFISDKNGNLTRTENRTNPTDVNPVSTTAYALNSGTNRLATAISASGTRAISYDARGNTAGETRPGAVTVTTGYDGYARLTSYQNSGSATLTNGYNGLDDRVTVTTAGAPADVRHYVFDQSGRMLGEYGASAATVKAETVWLTPDAANDNGAYGGGDGAAGYAPLALAVGTTLYWEHGNHLGVPLVITDSGGNTAAPTGYTKVGFPGQTQTLSDLYYNRYRDYDPTTGRYIQADPIGLAGGANPYLYAGGNPLHGIDPMGLEATYPTPPDKIPGGPWKPAGPGQPRGTFYGPKQPSGPRPQCNYIPPESQEGMPGADQPYYKTFYPKQRYSMSGDPIDIKQAHGQNERPSSAPPPRPWRWISPLFIGCYAVGICNPSPAY